MARRELIGLCLLLGTVLPAAFAATTTTITVNWDYYVFSSVSEASLQVVVNPMIRRGSPIHDQTFSALAELKANYVRFVPWLPYPKLSVAELQEPTGNPKCVSIVNDDSGYISCPVGSQISSIDFASYGTPSGGCQTFRTGRCNTYNATAIIQQLCLHQSFCSITVNSTLFGEPCPGVSKRLAVQASCSPTYRETYWDFELIDPMMEDFMEAQQGRSTVINFSTIPQWMFDTSQQVPYPSDSNEATWNYEQGKFLRDPTMQEIAEYYARIYQWYTIGGFYDEYQNWHESNHTYNIPVWEVLNEIDDEHKMSPAYYTQVYDAVVGALKSIDPDLKFVGLALENRNLDYVWYFLNQSNHRAGIPLDYFSYHFYATAKSRTDTSTFTQFFTDADAFLLQAAKIQQIKWQMSPSTQTYVDEIGVILPNDNVNNPQPIPALYWPAAGSMFAYVFANLQRLGVELIGQSQLVGYPSQFPSVSMMDWTDGQTNARYWTLALLLQHFAPSDLLINTTSSAPLKVFAQAYYTPNGRRLLLINKKDRNEPVRIDGVAGSTIQTIDETTGNGPARTSVLNSDYFVMNAFSTNVITYGGKKGPKPRSILQH